MLSAKEAREKSLHERQAFIAQELERIEIIINEAVLVGLTVVKVDRLTLATKDKLDDLGYRHYDHNNQTTIQW